ncbi:unnamed protein product [Thelazia callipaeda]|uniref:Metalloproteinase n=1 Tax=Thelazia callipaeda TaxID=103827 RepID=A0A0N5D3I9_THECL|nr:unnamed protein product [Thelazia callipaeda]
MLSVITLLVTCVFVTARPPTADEIQQELSEQQIYDTKDDYDLLPAVDSIPESLKESLIKQKSRYLDMLRQQNL